MLKKKLANKNYISFSSRIILKAIEKLNHDPQYDITIFIYLALFVIVIITMFSVVM